MNLKSIKVWLNIVTIAALLALIFFARTQIGDAFGRLADLNFFWLALIIPLQLGNYFSIAKFYQSYLQSLDEHLSTKFLFRVALEMNFVNNVFPTGGVSGFGYLGMRLRKVGVPVSKSTLTQVTKYSLTFLNFIIYLFLAMFLLAIFGSASRVVVLISTSIIFTVIIGAMLLIYLISSSSRIRAFTAFLPRAVNKFLGLFRRGRKTINVDRIENLFGDLHDDYMHVRRNWKSLKKPFLWTLLISLTELLTIFVVYLAFGSIVNFGAIIIAYAVANIAGLVAVLPGGVGVYEGLMTAVLATAGVDKALALSATLVYRVLNMSIFLPVGFVLYQVALRESPPDQRLAIETKE